MSIKDKITAFLFKSRGKEEESRSAVEEAQANAPDTPGQNFPVQSAFGAARVDVPSDHPIHRLYDLRRKEYGALPPIRLSLDEDSALPSDLVDRELKRVGTFLTAICSARMNEINRKPKSRPAKKKGEEKQEEEPPPPLDAQPHFFVSADKLYAWVIVLPPVRGGEEISRDLLYEAMYDQDISFGIEQRTVDQLASRNYFHLYLVAKGKPAFDGKNGNIVEHFPRVVERILDVDEYNQVDYTALNLIHNVKEGEEICRLILPTEGEPGRTVYDQEIPARGGAEVPLPQGRNTEISEDGLSLVASIAGHVEFTGRSFQVKPVMDIPGNVDFSVGDINFLGDVNITGDVLSGFTVRAMGNIHVGGVLEAGCTVDAGGDLVVVKGILGDGTTVISSQRSVFSKYIENAAIHVRENLQTDCIINGNIYCDGEVQVKSGRGTIMGGRIWAAKRILVKTLGAPSECRTTVVLGGMPCSNFEREQLRREMKELEMEHEKLECQPDSQVKSSLLQKVTARLSVAELKLRRLEAELKELPQGMELLDQGRLECGIAYGGSEIVHENEVFRLRVESRQFVATVVEGELMVM